MSQRPGPAAAHLVLLLTVGVGLVLLLSVQTAHAEGNIVSITVTVLNGLGEPLPNANVTAYYNANNSKVPNTGGRVGSAVTGSNGQAVLKLVDGTSDASYQIKVSYFGNILNVTDFNCTTNCPLTSFSVTLNV